jgi:hypothetical protein
VIKCPGFEWAVAGFSGVGWSAIKYVRVYCAEGVYLAGFDLACVNWAIVLSGGWCRVTAVI